MTSWEMYIPSTKDISALDEVGSKKFYKLQRGEGGRGPSVKVISPSEGAIDRAKMELKRGMKEGVVGPGINSVPIPRIRHSTTRSGSVNKKKKKVNKNKKSGAAKYKGKGSICKKVKRRYRKK